MDVHVPGELVDVRAFDRLIEESQDLHADAMVVARTTLPDLAIVYEHPEWFEPLFAALDLHGVSYVKVALAGHSFDPAASPAPAGPVSGRMYLRHIRTYLYVHISYLSFF